MIGQPSACRSACQEAVLLQLLVEGCAVRSEVVQGLPAVPAGRRQGLQEDAPLGAFEGLFEGEQAQGGPSRLAPAVGRLVGPAPVRRAPGVPGAHSSTARAAGARRPTGPTAPATAGPPPRRGPGEAPRPARRRPPWSAAPRGARELHHGRRPQPKHSADRVGSAVEGRAAPPGSPGASAVSDPAASSTSPGRTG